MRVALDPQGPWGVRVWFEDEEIEAWMDRDRATAGESSILAVTREGVDPEAVLLRVYGLTPDYVELPEGISGRTLVCADDRVEVQLSRELSDRAEGDVRARRRLRSTMAHECGHVALHAKLAAPAGSRRETRQVLCRDPGSRGPARGSSEEWWEQQANRAMAALLLPRDLLTEQLDAEMQDRGLSSLEGAFAFRQGMDVLKDLSEAFDVSFRMMLYRVKALKLLTPRPPFDPTWFQ
jgi:hypothetical protein